MRVPIACTLDQTAARSQLGEWQDVLGRSVVATERLAPTAVSFRLRADLSELDTVVALAQREKACCPFFEFVVRIEAESVSLHMSVPPEAVAVLDDFVGATSGC